MEGTIIYMLFCDSSSVEGFQLSWMSFTNLCQWNSWSEFVNLDAIHREKVEPLFISKVCLCSHSIKSYAYWPIGWKHDNSCWLQVNTVFQLMLVAAALLQPEFGTEETQNYITLLRWFLFHISTVVSLVFVFMCLHAFLCQSRLIKLWVYPV